MVKDAVGLEINEGDILLFPVSFGSTAVARVVSISSGLDKLKGAAQPHIRLELSIEQPVPPNGQVPLFKIGAVAPSAPGISFASPAVKAVPDQKG